MNNMWNVNSDINFSPKQRAKINNLASHVEKMASKYGVDVDIPRFSETEEIMVEDMTEQEIQQSVEKVPETAADVRVAELKRKKAMKKVHLAMHEGTRCESEESQAAAVRESNSMEATVRMLRRTIAVSEIISEPVCKKRHQRSWNRGC